MILGTSAFKRAALMGAATACLSFMGEGSAGDKEKEPSAFLEIGTAGEWGLAGGNFSLGPSLAIEFEPIKDCLEIEAGFAPLFGKGAPPAWSTDLLFKKPFTLSNTDIHKRGHKNRCRVCARFHDLAVAGPEIRLVRGAHL